MSNFLKFDGKRLAMLVDYNLSMFGSYTLSDHANEKRPSDTDVTRVPNSIQMVLQLSCQGRMLYWYERLSDEGHHNID